MKLNTRHNNYQTQAPKSNTQNSTSNVKKITFIVNGKYQKSKKFNALLNKIKGKYDLNVLPTERMGHATELVQQAAANGAEIIVAVGGDGTINEVVNGIVTLEIDPKPILAILPSGTANDFHKTLRERPLEQALADIKTKKIDVLELDFFDENNKKQKRYSVNIADVGIGALTIKIVNQNKHIFGGTMTFFLAVVRAFLSFKHFGLCLEADNLKYEGRVTTVAIANAKYFSGGLAIAPDAEFDDGIIDLTLIRKIKLMTFLKSFPKLQQGKKPNFKEISYHKTKTLTISSLANEKLPIEGDGEFFGFTPLEVKVKQKVLEVLC